MANAKETASAHTSGPWILRANGFIQEEAIVGKYDDYICQMPFSSLREAEEMGERQMSNAHLIAASPDLLDAVYDLLGEIEDGYPETEANPSVIAARRALDKAEGKVVASHKTDGAVPEDSYGNAA